MRFESRQAEPARTRRAFVIAASLWCLQTTACITPIIDLGSIGQVSPLVETAVVEKGEAKLAMLEIDGVISFDESGWGFGASQPNMVSRLYEALDLAARDDDVRGLIVRIRSPGGGVAASESVYHLLESWRGQTEKPVVAFFQEVAASGGYYAAMAADHVVAHPASITGSIGVMMPGLNVSGLMERFGVEDQNLTSGAFKDTGSAIRPMRPDERAQLQSVIDELYGQFVDVVDAGRPGLDRESVERLADGRVFTARQALEAGLVDEIGHFTSAIEAAEERAGIEGATLVVYRQRGQMARNIYSSFSSRNEAQPESGTEVNVFSFGAGAPPPAGFYYLWPPAFPR